MSETIPQNFLKFAHTDSGTEETDNIISLFECVAYSTDWVWEARRKKRQKSMIIIVMQHSSGEVVAITEQHKQKLEVSLVISPSVNQGRRLVPSGPTNTPSRRRHIQILKEVGTAKSQW